MSDGASDIVRRRLAGDFVFRPTSPERCEILPPIDDVGAPARLWMAQVPDLDQYDKAVLKRLELAEDKRYHNEEELTPELKAACDELIARKCAEMRSARDRVKRKWWERIARNFDQRTRRKHGEAYEAREYLQGLR